MAGALLDASTGAPFPQLGDQATGAALVKLAGGSVGGASNGSVFFQGTTSPLASGATYTSTVRDAGVAPGVPHPYAYFNAIFYSDQASAANGASIECSNTGAFSGEQITCAYASLSAGIPLILTVPVLFRYHRTKLVNGSSAQTTLLVNSSFTPG